MRAMTEPIAAAQSDAGTGSSWSRARSPSWSIAHNPTCSTPTERGTDELERIDVHALDVGSFARGAGACEQLGGDALRVRLQPRGAVVLQCELTGEDLVDPPAKRWPVGLRDLEVSSQVEQGALAHLGVDSLGTNEPIGEVHLAGGGATGLGAPDEHHAHGSRGRGPVQSLYTILWHYISHPNQLSITYVPKSTKSDARTGKSALTMLKMG